ncbi:MAG: SBBP repeat-containing protein [Bacteroidia bacterium]
MLLQVVFCLSVFGQNNRIWATYLGGAFTETCHDVANDQAGNAYITGYTSSASGVALNGYQNTYGGGNNDAFLAKFDPNGNLVWATYYGGPGDDLGENVHLDAMGNIYICGETTSTSQIAANGFQNTGGGNLIYDTFLVKFDPSGNRIWGTYYGELSGYDLAKGIETDNLGNVYFCGQTTSTTGIASGGDQNTFGGGQGDAFLVKFDALGNRIWATYFGGAGEDIGNSVVVDNLGDVYMTGETQGNTAVFSGGFQNTYGGGVSDAYLIKYDPAGSRIWATYYGDIIDASGNCLAIDNANNVYLGGQTSDFANIAAGGFQNTFGGGLDGLLVKFDASGNRIWGTYFGGPAPDYILSVDLDAAGNIFIAGDSYSASGVALGGFQNVLLGSEDNFLAKIDPYCNLVCATYFGLGPLDTEDGHGTISSQGYLYLSGWTSSLGLAFNGYQNTYGGGIADAYLARFTVFENTGVDAISYGNEISISPNPCSESVMITIQNPGTEMQLSIVNLLGEQVLFKKISEAELKLELGFLADGVYTLYIHSSDGLITRKIIKQK